MTEVYDASLPADCLPTRLPYGLYSASLPLEPSLLLPDAARASMTRRSLTSQEDEDDHLQRRVKALSEVRIVGPKRAENLLLFLVYLRAKGPEFYGLEKMLALNALLPEPAPATELVSTCASPPYRVSDNSSSTTLHSSEDF